MAAYKKGFFNGWEVVIVDFFENYNQNGQACRYAKCFLPALETCESILLSEIYIVNIMKDNFK